MGMQNPAKIRWAPRLRPPLLERLYDSDAKGFQDMELCNKVGFALYARCHTFALVHRQEVECPECGTVFAVASQGKSHCPQEGCHWYTTISVYNQSVRNHYAHTGRAVDAFLSFHRRYPKAKPYQEKILLIDRLIHSFHVDEKSGDPTKSVASKLLEGNKKAVVRFLDDLSALNPEDKQRWRRTVARTIDRRVLRSDPLDKDLKRMKMAWHSIRWSDPFTPAPFQGTLCAHRRAPPLDSAGGGKFIQRRAKSCGRRSKARKD